VVEAAQEAGAQKAGSALVKGGSRRQADTGPVDDIDRRGPGVTDPSIRKNA
jgi:hypothetical protein